MPTPEFIGQMRHYDQPEAVPDDRRWVSPIGGSVYVLPERVRAVYGHTCSGAPIVEKIRLALGYTVSVDRHGYDILRGTQEIAIRFVDGSGALARQRDGVWRGFRRVAEAERKDDWAPDPSALRDAFAAAGVAATASAGVDRWLLVTQVGAVKKWLIAAMGGKGAPGLYIHGGTGTGKTTALRAIESEWVGNAQRLVYLDVPELVRQIRAGYSDAEASMQTNATIAEAQRTPLLLLDDLTAAPKKDDLWLTLHTLVDRRLDAKLPTVIADNAAPGEWGRTGIDKRLASRLHMLAPLDFGQVDHRRK